MRTSEVMSSSPQPERRILGDERLGRRLVANTVANSLGQGILLVLAFVSTPYIVNHLGPSLYGILILLFAYIETFALLDLGLNIGLVKFLAELLPQGKSRDVSAYLNTALTLFICVGIVITLCVALAASRLAAYLLGPQTEFYGAVVFGFWVAGGAFLARFVGQAFSAVSMAAQRFDLANYVTVGSETLRAAGSMAVLYAGYRLEGVVLVSLLVNVLAFGAHLLIARHLIPNTSFWPRLSLQHARELLHFGKFMLVANISARLVHSADKIILGHFLSVASVGFYAVPYSLGQKLWIFVGSVTGVVLPAASALTGRQSSGQLKELYLRGSKFTVAAAGFPTLALYLFRQEVLQLWIGPSFALHGAFALGLLSWAFLINGIAHLPVAMLLAAGRPQVAARFAALNACLNIILLIILAPRFGINGAAAGFLLVQLILTPCLMHIVNQSLDVSWPKLLVRSYLPSGAACVIGGVVCWLLEPFAVSLGALLAVLGIGLIIYASAVLIIVFDRTDRAACHSFLSVSNALWTRTAIMRWKS